MAERLNAPVLKTGDCNRSLSSNLSLPATFINFFTLPKHHLITIVNKKCVIMLPYTA